MNLEWMYWTLPTAIFFIAIFLVLTAMTIWQTLAPSVPRRGFLPLVTTPGTRLFVGLICAAFIHLAWLGFTDLTLWIVFPFAVGWIIVVMIWG
jgi:Predicted small integral membrane protein